MSFKHRKVLLNSFLSLFMVIILLLTACTALPEDTSPGGVPGDSGDIILEGIVLTNGIIFITKSDIDQQLTNQLISIAMPDEDQQYVPGALMEFSIKSEILESYPMQATGISSSALQDVTATIKAPIHVGSTMLSLMPDDVYFIDVRTAEEFSGGHIDGAINMPLNDLETLLSTTISDKNKTILLYCRSGNRSATAAELLKELDYSIVFDLGGVNTYKGDLIQESP